MKKAKFAGYAKQSKKAAFLLFTLLTIGLLALGLCACSSDASTTVNDYPMPYANDIKGTITLHAESADGVVDTIMVEVKKPWSEMGFIGERYLNGEFNEQDVDDELGLLMAMCINGEMGNDLVDGINVVRNSMDSEGVDYAIEYDLDKLMVVYDDLFKGNDLNFEKLSEMYQNAAE